MPLRLVSLQWSGSADHLPNMPLAWCPLTGRAPKVAATRFLPFATLKREPELDVDRVVVLSRGNKHSGEGGLQGNIRVGLKLHAT